MGEVIRSACEETTRIAVAAILERAVWVGTNGIHRVDRLKVLVTDGHGSQRLASSLKGAGVWVFSPQWLILEGSASTAEITRSRRAPPGVRIAV